MQTLAVQIVILTLELNMDVVVVPCGAAALKANFRMLDVQALKDMGFDQDLFDPIVPRQPEQSFVRAGRVQGPLREHWLKPGQIPSQIAPPFWAVGWPICISPVPEGRLHAIGEIAPFGVLPIQAKIKFAPIRMTEMREKGEGVERRKSPVQCDGLSAGKRALHVARKIMCNSGQLRGDKIAV